MIAPFKECDCILLGRRAFNPLMSIANELSSDVAAAVLTRQSEAPTTESKELVGVIMEVHTTLRHLTVKARTGSRRAQGSSDMPPAAGTAASGSH